MMWVDYTIDQAGPNFKVNGDWPGEVMGVQQDGTAKDHWLYKPGDRFIVNEAGWLMKVEAKAAEESSK
tara:strand:- start:1426 stop:1629 length:204 start_codon:yes stop_codon:yes gene_type:complete